MRERLRRQQYIFAPEPWRRWVAFCLLFAALPATAAYQVVLTAPEKIRNTLWEHLDIVRFRDRDDIDIDRLNFLAVTAKQQIENLTAVEGYFSPIAHISVESVADHHSVQIDVDPGLRTTVSKVEIELTGAVVRETPKLADRLRKTWRLPLGQAFRQQDWDSAKEQALHELQGTRYAAARLDESRAKIRVERQAAELFLHFDSGPVFTLGPLQVTGTERYPEVIVHNVSPLVVGEIYRVERLHELQRQILSTPYFSNAVVAINRDPTQAELTPVQVRVTEFRTQRVRTGAGFASDTGAHIEGLYEHNNVFERAWVFTGNAKLEQKRQFGSVQLAMPPGKQNRVNSVHVLVDRTTLRGADLRSMRAGVQRAHHSDKFDIAWMVDYYRDELLQTNGLFTPGQTIIAPGTHRALVPAVSWTRRAVDDLIFPRQGHTVSAQAGFAKEGVLADQNFMRLYGKVRQYVPIGKRDLIVAHAELGGLFSKGSNAAVPASLLFRAGGTDSIRGYGYQSIGNEQNGTVYPTRYVATAGAEYQRWFTAQWGGAVFYDLGTATDQWSDKIIFRGVGIGARWRSPVGSVQVDVAYAMRTKRFRPHISLGVAF